MSRAKGRRIAARADEQATRNHPTRATGVVSAVVPGVVAVAATAASLVWGGQAHEPHVTGSAPGSRTTAVARDFICAGGLPGTSATIGVAGQTGLEGLSVDDDPATRANVRVADTEVAVHAAAEVSARAFAVRAAASKTWYAAAACPSPRSAWWFVGAGASEGHHTGLTVANPREGDAIVDIEVFGPHGVVEAPGLDDIRIASGSVERFDLRKVAPAVGNLAVRVTASRGLVGVSAAETWSARFVARPVLDWVTGQPAANRRITLAGLPAHTARARLLVGNPTSTEAVVRLSLLGPDGVFAPTAHAITRIGPGKVRSLSLADVLKADPLGLRISSQVPVTATVRVRHGTDAAYLPVVEPLGGSSVVGVPGHPGSASLALVGATKDRPARVLARDASGDTVLTRSVAAGPNAVATVELPRETTSVEVRGKRVSGALVLGADSRNALAVVPLLATGSQAKVPAVSGRW